MMGDVMENLIGLGVSLAYVLAVLGASSLAARRGASSEATRKLAHIALGGWWLIAARFFDSPLWAAALPAAFILVNAFAYRRQKLSFMGRDGGEDTPGTVYYAVSLTALALFSFGIGTPYVGALGFFCMAFGDGFAAVLGKRFGRRVLVGCCGKTLVGSATMLAVSFASCAVVLMAPPPFGAGGILGAPGGAFAPLGSLAASLLAAALLAAVAAAIEAFSVEGLDNLFVPLGVSALYAVPSLPLLIVIPVIVGVTLRSPANMVIVLTLYGVAVLVRQVAEGFRAIPRATLQAANACGYSLPRRFVQVELPLATPVIVAGTRVVATSTVSLVTVGAFIGVRSLGTLFTDGFQRGLVAEVVAGLVATVLLALVIDALIQGIGWALTPWTRRGLA